MIKQKIASPPAISFLLGFEVVAMEILDLFSKSSLVLL